VSQSRFEPGIPSYEVKSITVWGDLLGLLLLRTTLNYLLHIGVYGKNRTRTSEWTIRECTYFPKIWKPRQNSTCHTSDTKQYWGPTNIRRHRTKCSRPGGLAVGIPALMRWLGVSCFFLGGTHSYCYADCCTSGITLASKIPIEPQTNALWEMKIPLLLPH
jgi:hypothetical protein